LVTLDKKEFIVYKGNPGALYVPESHRLPQNEVAPFIGTQRIYGNAEHSNFIVSRITLTTKP
jgi:hypothetical protein